MNFIMFILLLLLQFNLGLSQEILEKLEKTNNYCDNKELEAIRPLYKFGYNHVKFFSPQESDLSIIVFYALYVDIARFDAYAPYHPTAVGILTHVERRPAEESENCWNRVIAAYHAYYHVSNGHGHGQSFKKVMTKVLGPEGVKLDSTNMSTPEGIGNFVGKHVAHVALNNGMNEKGDFGGGKYNLKPFADYTGYSSINTLTRIVDPTQWQPHGHYGSKGIQTFSQEFVTPQMAFLIPYSVSRHTLEHITVKPHGRSLYNPRKYHDTTNEVIEAVASLTKRQKVIAEYFNNKTAISTSLIRHRLSKYNLSAFQFISGQLKASVAAYDAAIATWKEKRRYNAVRPFTAVRYLYGRSILKGYSIEYGKAVDDMPATDWESYIPTANHPEYPSASAGFCGANAEIMRLESGMDNTNGFVWKIHRGSSFVEKDQPEEDVILTYDTWTDWENDCALSRFVSGTHFKDAVEEGLPLGRTFGKTADSFVNEKIGGPHY